MPLPFFRIVGKAIVGPVVEVVVAESVAAETAEPDAGPVVDTRNRRPSLHRKVCADCRRSQSQHPERDGGEKDSFHLLAPVDFLRIRQKWMMMSADPIR